MFPGSSPFQWAVTHICSEKTIQTLSFSPPPWGLAVSLWRVTYCHDNSLCCIGLSTGSFLTVLKKKVIKWLPMMLSYTHRSELAQPSSEKFLSTADGNTKTHSQTLHRVRDLETSCSKQDVSIKSHRSEFREHCRREGRESVRARRDGGRQENGTL